MMVVGGTSLNKGMDNIHHQPTHPPHQQQLQGPSASPQGKLPPKSPLSPPQPAPLVRPRSVDDLLNGSSSLGGSTAAHNGGGGSSKSSNSREPALEDLAESEVFVGSEDEEDDVGHVALPPSSSLTISYHDEPRLPLHAVQEEVEAEEAEEAAMSLSLMTTSQLAALQQSPTSPHTSSPTSPLSSSMTPTSVRNTATNATSFEVGNNLNNDSSPFVDGSPSSVSESNIMAAATTSNSSSSGIPIASSMNSLNSFTNDIFRLQHESAVRLGGSADSNGHDGGHSRTTRIDCDPNTSLSKSGHALENEPCDVIMTSSMMDGIPNGTTNGNNGFGGHHHHEIDLTDGIPSLGDLSCSGIDEGVNLDHSPYSDGSPLSHSLASSVASNMSLDDTLSSRTDTSSYTDTQDTVVAIVQKNPSSRLPHKESQLSRISPRPARPGSGKTSGTAGGGKPQRSLEPSSRTPECKRRGAAGIASPRVDGTNRSSTAAASSLRTGTSSSRNSPRLSTSDRSSKVEEKKKCLKAPVHDRRTCRNSSSLGTTVSFRSKVADIDPPSRKSRGDSKSDTKDSRLSEPRYGTLERKKKEKSSKEVEEYESSTLPRRKKKVDRDAAASEIPRAWHASDSNEVEKYGGTLGRRKKVREAGDGREETHGAGAALTKENKDTLDTYATLPRRKAREMTARWREQNLQQQSSSSYADHHQTVPHINLHAPSSDGTSSGRPLRRSRSIGKGESSRSISSYNNSTSSSSSGGGGFVRSTARPSPRLVNGTHSPAPSPRPGTATQTPRKERTIICLETAIQTALAGHEVAAAMRALARVSCQDDAAAADARPRIEIVRDYPLPASPKHKPSHCDAQVQVDVGWGVCSCGARRETARSAESEELQRLLKEERLAKEEVQEELDRTSQKIRDMLASMEGVEKEFNQRCDSLVVLESQLQHSTRYNSRLQDRLTQYEDYTITMRKDLCSCQERERLLQQQVTELEAESRELAEFMGSEKEALTECLREAEAEAARLRQLCEDREAQIEHREAEATILARLAEERRVEIDALSSELSSVQGRTRDLMVCQGAQVSSAAVTLSNLAVRLQALTARLVHDYSVTESDLQNIVTPSESDSSSSSSATASPEHKLSPFSAPRSSLLGGALAVARTPSPRKPPASFIHAVLHALRGGPHCTSLPSKQVKEGRNSPDGSEAREPDQEGGGSGTSVSLVDQVAEVDVLLSRFLKVCCVLKNDSDQTMNEVQEESERLSQEVRCQQQLIEQQQSDYEALTRALTRVQREVAALTRAKDKQGGSSDVRRSLSMDCADVQQQQQGAHRRDTVWSPSQEGPSPQLEGLWPSAPPDASTSLLLVTALKTLEGLPEVVSSQPSLKHLLNSLKANSYKSQLAQQKDTVVNGHDAASLADASDGKLAAPSAATNGDLRHSEVNANGTPTVAETLSTAGDDTKDLKGVMGEDVQEDGSSCNGAGTNLNDLNNGLVQASQSNEDRSNGNAALELVASNAQQEGLFDLNANPPSFSPTSPPCGVQSPAAAAGGDCNTNSPPSSLPSMLEVNDSYTSPKKVSPNGLNSPHSPLLQKSSPHASDSTSPMGEHVARLIPGVGSPIPMLVQTETHL